MAVINTSKAAKALWPGIKKYWGEEYTEKVAAKVLSGGFVPVYKAEFEQVKIVDTVETEEDAKAYVEMLTDVINNIAKTKRVYIWKKPEWWVERDFDTATSEVRVAARFSIDTSDSTESGIIENIAGMYDKVGMRGFGLASIKKEGTYEHVTHATGYTVTKEGF